MLDVHFDQAVINKNEKHKVHTVPLLLYFGAHHTQTLLYFVLHIQPTLFFLIVPFDLYLSFAC